MDSNKNVGVAPQSTPAVSENIMAQGISAEKSNKGMIIGMVFLAILAIGGIGFGVWAWMDGNAQKNNFNSQIADLNSQKAKLLEQINDSEDEDIDIEYKNPIIKSSSSEEEYSVWLMSSIVDGKKIQIGVKDGKVDSCYIQEENTLSAECAINGVSGEIYDMIEFGEGQDNTYSNIGFIMTDGTIQYFPLVAAIKNNDFSIKGTLNIDGFVIDVIEISAGKVSGGYGSTVFVLNDGSFVKYNESMLN